MAWRTKPATSWLSRRSISWVRWVSTVLSLVIAGDIKIKLVDIELLTIQIRLVVASVDKARETGLDWWTTNADFRGKPAAIAHQAELDALGSRIAQLEERLSQVPLRSGTVSP
jgi:hypothetical protein